MASELPTKLVNTVECKQGAVRAVRFNTDGNYCITCGSDKSVKLWNPYKGLLLKAYTGKHVVMGRIKGIGSQPCWLCFAFLNFCTPIILNYTPTWSNLVPICNPVR